MKILNQLAQKRFRVELTWVKAHNNYTGNERTDELARNAVYNNIIQFNIDPPHSYFKKQRKHLCQMDREVGNKKCLQNDQAILSLP